MTRDEPVRGTTILVVDDDLYNRELLVNILEHQGYQTLCAEDGARALDILHDQTVDLVLLDVMMPILNGFDVCRRIRATPRWSSLPIIMVTALDSEGDQVTGMDAGANDFVSKPIQRSALLSRVRAHLRSAAHHKRAVDEGQQLATAHRELQALEEARDQLTHMVVHDLKSPLQALELSLETLEVINASPTDIGATTLSAPDSSLRSVPGPTPPSRCSLLPRIVACRDDSRK